MRIGKHEVIVLCGGDLDEAGRSDLAEAVTNAGFTVAGVLTGVNEGGVNGDDGQGYAHNVIRARPEKEAPALPVRDDD